MATYLRFAGLENPAAWIWALLWMMPLLSALAQAPATNGSMDATKAVAVMLEEDPDGSPLAPARIQDAGKTGRPQGHGVAVRAGYRWDVPVDLSDKDNVSAQHSDGGVTVRLPVSETIMGSLDLDMDYVSYSFSVDDDSLFAASGLMRHAADVRISPMLMGRVSERWGWMARATGAFTGETDADAGKSFSPGGMAGMVYNCGPDLKLTFGIVASALLADELLVFPIVGFDWALTERLRLATRGPGLDVIMKLAPETTLTLKGRWDYRRYRLADTAPVPDGVFRDQRVDISLELSRRFRRVMELTLAAGTSVYQQYKLENSDEDTVARIDTDPQAFLGVRMALSL